MTESWHIDEFVVDPSRDHVHRSHRSERRHVQAPLPHACQPSTSGIWELVIGNSAEPAQGVLRMGKHFLNRGCRSIAVATLAARSARFCTAVFDFSLPEPEVQCATEALVPAGFRCPLVVFNPMVQWRESLSHTNM